jgi:hypothetical protein
VLEAPTSPSPVQVVRGDHDMAVNQSIASPVSSFLALLERAVSAFGSQSAAAEAIGMDRTRFGRVLLQRRNPRADKSPASFDVENCLRLSRATSHDASDVLRLAGKADVAEIIEELYGPPREPRDMPDVRISVAAYPSHARVFVNGKEVGR